MFFFFFWNPPALERKPVIFQSNIFSECDMCCDRTQ